jgi:ribosomal protein L25 (general stress protein Ctc)
MSEAAWNKAFTQGSKAMQDRLMKVHAKNPKFQAWLQKSGHGAGVSVKQASKEVKATERAKKLAQQSLKAYGATKGQKMGGEDGSGETLRDTIAPLTRDQHSKVQAAQRAAKAAAKPAKPAAPKKPLTKDQRLAAIAAAARKAKTKHDVPTMEPDDEGYDDLRDLHQSLHIRRGYNEEMEKVNEIVGVLAAMDKADKARSSNLKVGDNVRSIKMPIPGKVEKIENGKVYFRHESGKLYATHAGNLRKEEIELEEGRMKDIATDREETARLAAQEKEPPFTPDKNPVRRGRGGPMSQAKWLAKQAMMKKIKEMGMKEEVEQIDEAKVDPAKQAARQYASSHKNLRVTSTPNYDKENGHEGGTIHYVHHKDDEDGGGESVSFSHHEGKINVHAEHGGVVGPNIKPKKFSSVEHAVSHAHSVMPTKSSDDSTQKSAHPFHDVGRALHNTEHDKVRELLKNHPHPAAKGLLASLEPHMKAFDHYSKDMKKNPGKTQQAYDKAKEVFKSATKNIKEEIEQTDEALRVKDISVSNTLGSLKKAKPNDNFIAKDRAEISRSIAAHDVKWIKKKTAGNPDMRKAALKRAGYEVVKEVAEEPKHGDAGEYDYEGDMAKSQLRSIMTNAKRMHDMLEDNTNLPEWVQSKITLAEDYVLTATNYMESEMNEEVEQIDEASHFRYGGEVNGKEYEVTIPRHRDLGDYSDAALHRKLSKENPHLDHHEVTAIVHSGGEEESKVDVEHEGKKYTHHVINYQEPQRIYSEEVEQVDEKYMGFKKLAASIKAKGGARDPAAVAASIGRKKYGKEKFQAAAAAGKKMSEALDPVGKEDSDIDNDGDSDKTDVYLATKRKAIGKAIKDRLAKKLGK